MKDNFSQQADLYASYRPAYPPELFEFILQHISNRQAAWDCATGNGQTAKELSCCFEKVFATDISRRQLDRAIPAANILYSVQPAEQTGFDNDSFDLVTVSQALHWFDFEKFYKEVKRVGKPGSWIAAWMYSLLRISNDIDKIIETYHFETLKAYWDPERKYVDEQYTTIPFPFEEIATPSFIISYDWSLSDLEGYLHTWSALQKFITAENDDPVPGLIATIRPLWQGTKMQVRFPLRLRMGRIE